MFDLAQAQPDSLALNEKSDIRDQLKGLLPDSEELDTPEDAFQTAIYLAEKYPFLIGGYQNEFIVYQNPSGNWWIVLSSRWVIVLSKGNGDLIFAAMNYDYEDLSLPLTG